MNNVDKRMKEANRLQDIANTYRLILEHRAKVSFSLWYPDSLKLHLKTSKFVTLKGSQRWHTCDTFHIVLEPEYEIK